MRSALRIKEALVLTGVLFVLIIFIFFTKEVISPLFLVPLGLFLLWPFRRQPVFRRLFYSLVLLFFLYIFLRMLPIIYPFLGAILITYIFAPLVDWLEEKKWPRSVSSLGIVFLILAGIGGLFYIVAPAFWEELRDSYELLYSYISNLPLNLEWINRKLVELGIDINVKEMLLKAFPDIKNVQKLFLSSIKGIYTGITTLIEILFGIFLALFISYYGLKNSRNIKEGIKKFIARRKNKKIYLKLVNEIDRALSSYLRSQFILALIVGIIIALSLFVVGVKYWLLLGILAGVFQLIPNIGYVLSLIPAFLIGIVSPSPIPTLIKIAIVFLGEQLLENYLIGPKIIGEVVGLNPALVITALVIGGYFGGIVGMLIAVPVTSVLKVFWENRKDVMKLI